MDIQNRYKSRQTISDYGDGYGARKIINIYQIYNT